MAILTLTGAESLRNKSVEAHEQSCAEKCEDDEDVRAEADGAHGGGAIGQMANHHGVHDGHAHPAKLGEDQREGKAHRGRKFLAKSFQMNHGWLCDEVYGEESE